MDFHEQLRLALAHHGLTPADLARQMQPPVSRQAVTYWLGINKTRWIPRKHHVAQLEALLGTRFAVPGGTADAHADLPPGVTAEHVELAVQLSQLPAAEYAAITALINAGHARSVRKVTHVPAFFVFNDRRRSAEHFFNIEPTTNAEHTQGGATYDQSFQRGSANPRTAAG